MFVPGTVGVIGAGTMGSGIAVVAARAGHRTVLHDVDDARVAAGIDRVHAFLARSTKLGKLSADQADQARRGLSGSTALEELSDCDVVIEAVYEDVAVKQRLFADLDDICKPDTLFHTNTSTLAVTAIAAGSVRRERVVGTHYCNPAPLMSLVEVVEGRHTSADACRRTHEFLAGVGKTTVTTKDMPGFIVNRFLIPFENNAIRLLEMNMGTVESIDKAVTQGLRYPMGPFTLLDIVGLDVHRAVSISLYEQLREPRFAPPPLVDRMIASGDLGRKSGRGFYTYDSTGHFGS
ncbi:3-hydroxyacyl-CoA dehydrogenase family protein [Jatrophihabitans cynanchi]|uniref:3-hydroxyacyl-CoA dehydrogenase family protein n=1 Tax=Jatrophihabitans cynanchi TaxID=2944128 RepID=A0ABY7K0L8_9ACTN|nr:3-hydroxyacyl-CoA dehydrogenase family protein [Jatrophihabitans sp. SB3-54]WAX58390.1 3-hydroxyacyl-CoA dehydrogenase family protein [Jatrophihabitans sp. SB3-54]